MLITESLSTVPCAAIYTWAFSLCKDQRVHTCSSAIDFLIKTFYNDYKCDGCHNSPTLKKPLKITNSSPQHNWASYCTTDVSHLCSCVHQENLHYFSLDSWADTTLSNWAAAVLGWGFFVGSVCLFVCLLVLWEVMGRNWENYSMWWPSEFLWDSLSKAYFFYFPIFGQKNLKAKI